MGTVFFSLGTKEDLQLILWEPVLYGVFPSAVADPCAEQAVRAEHPVKKGILCHGSQYGSAFLWPAPGFAKATGFARDLKSAASPAPSDSLGAVLQAGCRWRCCTENLCGGRGRRERPAAACGGSTLNPVLSSSGWSEPGGPPPGPPADASSSPAPSREGELCLPSLLPPLLLSTVVCD